MVQIIESTTRKEKKTNEINLSIDIKLFVVIICLSSNGLIDAYRNKSDVMTKLRKLLKKNRNQNNENHQNHQVLRACSLSLGNRPAISFPYPLYQSAL